MSRRKEQNWSYKAADDGEAYPKDLIGAVWSFLQWSKPVVFRKPRSEGQLANLIQPAYQASLCSEEGRQVRFRVVFAPQRKRFTVQFADPLPYTASQLVKLSPTIGLGSRWLIALPEKPGQDSVRIAGVLDPDILPADRTHQRWGNGGLTGFQDQIQGLKVAAMGPGWVRVSTTSDSFDLRNCCMRRRLLVLAIRYVNEWFVNIPSYLGIADISMGAAVARRFLVTVLAKISEARHGGCLLILPDQVKPSSLPLKIRYPVDSNIVQMTIKQRSLVGPKHFVKGGLSGEDGPIDPGQIVHDESTLSDSLLLDRDLAQVIDLVASLAAVDGAVVLTRSLELAGFGAEITVSGTPPENLEVEYGNHPSPLGKPPAASLADLGMRHRSAYRFCREVPGTIAFVVSQDGGIQVFCDVDGTVKRWIDLSAEEW